MRCASGSTHGSRTRRRRQSRHPADVRPAEELLEAHLSTSTATFTARRSRSRSTITSATRPKCADGRRDGAERPNRTRCGGARQAAGLPLARPRPGEEAPRRAPPAMSDAPDKTNYRSTVFLPKTDFPMKAGLPQKEPAILARWAEERLYEQLREARRARALHPPRRPALRQWRHPHRPRDEQDHQGHGRPLAVAARQGRALRPRLGLPRPADRVEDRGAVPQEEARQGRGADQRSSAPSAAPMPSIGSTCSASSSSGSASPATGTSPT